MTDRRLTQLPIEVGLQDSAPARRLTQLPIEVGLQDSAPARRLTQLVIEVPINNPVHPFGDTPVVYDPPWSPSFIQAPIEGQEHQYASFYGPQRQKIDLGARRRWIRLIRR